MAEFPPANGPPSNGPRLNLGDQRRTRRAVAMGLQRWPPTPMPLCRIKWSRGPPCVGRIAFSIIPK